MIKRILAKMLECLVYCAAFLGLAVICAIIGPFIALDEIHQTRKQNEQRKTDKR